MDMREDKEDKQKPVEVEVESLQSEENGDPGFDKKDGALQEIAGAQEVAALKEELAKSRDEAAEYLDGWQRSRAEFANYKKRVERDQALVYQNAVGNILKRYVEIVDDLERALKNRPESGEGAAWANGIELVYRKLWNILESEGVQPIDAEGQFFDPNLHEAITSEENEDYESGQIIEVLQRGYMLGDKVLRPARVRVAR